MINTGLKLRKNDDVPRHYARAFKWIAAMLEPYGSSHAAMTTLEILAFDRSVLTALGPVPTAESILH